MTSITSNWKRPFRNMAPIRPGTGVERFTATDQFPWLYNHAPSVYQFKAPTPDPAAKLPEMYFDKQVGQGGVFGDPGTVPAQDIDEPLARDVAWLVRNRHETSQSGPTTDKCRAELAKQHPIRFNLNQPLGAIGLNQDRIAKLLLRAEDINGLYYGLNK